MILWKSKEVAETRIGEYYPLAFRWMFQIGKFYVGFTHQYKSKHDNKWHDNHSVNYLISITKYFHWGSYHLYYDGCHCTFSLGWIHFLWSNDNCKKCRELI